MCLPTAPLKPLGGPMSDAHARYGRAMNDSHGDHDASPRPTDTTDGDCAASAARTPTRCLSCEGALDGSLEHVFPQALGGTTKNRNLY
jgi:hypothetical protein